jgi:tetratricopeptide (TPR) repeat protein
MGLSGLLLYLGFPDQAFLRSRELAALEAPFSTATKLYAAAIALRAGHATWAREMITSVPAPTEAETSDVRTVILGNLVRALLLMHEQNFHGALTMIREATAIAEAEGNKTWRSSSVPVLLEACAKTGQADEGLKAADEELSDVERSSTEPELLRLKGELLLIKDRPAARQEAENYFRCAIALAHSTSAKFFELRAAISLARLLAGQGKRDEARAQLARIYAWFTEGFETPDLKEAKALLDELSH